MSFQEQISRFGIYFYLCFVYLHSSLSLSFTPHMYPHWLMFRQALCTEAGLLALRERRMKVTHEDLRQAKEKVLYKKNDGVPEGLYL